MSLFSRARRLFRPRPATAEELEAAQDAKRAAYEQDSIRASQGTTAGQNYQSGRGSRP